MLIIGPGQGKLGGAGAGCFPPDFRLRAGGELEGGSGCQFHYRGRRLGRRKFCLTCVILYFVYGQDPVVNADFMNHSLGEKLFIIVVVRANLVKGIGRILYRTTLRVGCCGDFAIHMEFHRGAIVSCDEVIPLPWDEILTSGHIV